MVAYMCIWQYICIKYVGAFLNSRQISVLVLLLAAFRTCSPALLSEHARAHSVCVCVRAQRKAPARAIFAAAASTAAAYHERACAMTLPRAEGAGPAGIDHCSDSLVGSPRSTHSSS